MEANQETLAATAPSVMVSFFTNTFSKEVNEGQAFSVPKTITKNGLSNLVNKLLGNSDDDAVPFDFLYNDEFIAVSFDKFLKRRPNINTDDTLALEYTPAMSMEEGNEVPHDDWVSSLSAPFFNSGEEILVSGCYDRRVRLLCAGEVLSIGDGHSGAVKQVVAVNNQRAQSAKGGKRRRHVDPFQAISASKDGTVRLWSYDDAKGLRSVQKLTHHKESVDAVAVSPNMELACSGSWDKSIVMFKLADCFKAGSEDDIQKATLTGHSRPVLACKFTSDSQRILSTGLDGQLKTWDVTRASFISTYSGEYSAYSMDLGAEAATSNYVLTGHSDNRARLWDIREKAPTKTYSGHTGWIYDIKWCPAGAAVNGSGNCFVTASEDSTVGLFDLRSQRPLSTHALHTDGVFSLCFTSPDVVASGSKDTTIRTTTLSSFKGSK